MGVYAWQQAGDAKVLIPKRQGLLFRYSDSSSSTPRYLLSYFLFMYRWVGRFGPDLHFRGRSIFNLEMVGYGRNEESCLGHFSCCGMVYIEGLNGNEVWIWEK